MRLAMLSPVAWRTPPRHYGPWEGGIALNWRLVAEASMLPVRTADSKPKAGSIL
jgi:hypothetical protein